MQPAPLPPRSAWGTDLSGALVLCEAVLLRGPWFPHFLGDYLLLSLSPPLGHSAVPIWMDESPGAGQGRGVLHPSRTIRGALAPHTLAESALNFHWDQSALKEKEASERRLKRINSNVTVAAWKIIERAGGTGNSSLVEGTPFYKTASLPPRSPWVGIPGWAVLASSCGLSCRHQDFPPSAARGVKALPEARKHGSVLGA